MAWTAMIVAALVLNVAWIAIARRGLVHARSCVDASWAALDAQLRARHDLVPTLLETVRAFGASDRAALQDVAAAREDAVAADDGFVRCAAERRLDAALHAVLVQADAEPPLRDAEAFRVVRARLAELERSLQAARRIYNADVRLYLARRRRVGGALSRGLGELPERPYFELDHTRVRRADGEVALAA